LRTVANKALLVVFKRKIGELGRRVGELGERVVCLGSEEEEEEQEEEKEGLGEELRRGRKGGRTTTSRVEID
jgi:hypothetical protein